MRTVSKVHNERHAEARNQRIYNIAERGASTGYQPQYAPLVQGTLQAQTPLRAQVRCQRYYSYKEAFYQDLQYTYRFKQKHNICKIGIFYSQKEISTCVF